MMVFCSLIVIFMWQWENESTAFIYFIILTVSHNSVHCIYSKVDERYPHFIVEEISFESLVRLLRSNSLCW